MTYYVYKMSTINNRKEDYLRYIVESYYRVEKDSKELMTLHSKEDDLNSESITQLCRLITINCTLMIYYVKRFPGYNHVRNDLWKDLYTISINPTDFELYDKLSSTFARFCLGIKKKKTNSITFSLDPEKQGYAQENF